MFDRLSLILNKQEMEKISGFRVLIVGVGGVGGYVLESLVRTGVNKITIVDGDFIDLSNINRQIIALNTNLEESKVEVAKNRCLNINPNANITAIQLFIDQSNIDSIDFSDYDYIVDACDTITTKVLLIKKAKEYNINIISCMGTGNRLNPSNLTITNISKTYNDPLAKIIRKLLKKEQIDDCLVCWSSELPKKVNSRIPGSAIFVPAAAGLIIGSYIIKQLLKED